LVIVDEADRSTLGDIIAAPPTRQRREIVRRNAGERVAIVGAGRAKITADALAEFLG
jgi:hypothetical protein